MNDEMKNTNPNGIEKKLLDVAGRTNADPHFVSELESKLKNTHKPKTSWSMPMFKQATSALGWVALVAMLGYFLNWSFATLIPTQQPGTNTTPNQFVCPVTEPNGSTPPLEQPSPYHHGNGEIWTDLWPGSKIYMQPDNRETDGSFSMKWVWWRNATGTLDIQGQRLDANAEPLRVFYTGGYDDTGVYVVALIFPTTGCWEVTGYVGDTSLTFVTEVLYNATSTPTPPEPIVVTSVVTAPPEDGGYAWRDTKLYLAQSLPESEIEANIYLLNSNQPVTIDDVSALAQRFGIQGEAQAMRSEFPNQSDYMITDGKNRLQVRSDHYFTYQSNFGSLTLEKPTEEQARSIIDNFLKQRGYNFEYRLESAPEMPGQQYYITPLTADGFEMRFDYMFPVRFEITLDNTGQNLIFTGYAMDYESIGTFGIVTVEEAFQKILNPNPQTGLIEISRGHGGGSGGSSFHKLNLSGTPVPFPVPAAAPEIILGSGEYIVLAGDSLNTIAYAHSIAVDELMQANGLTDPIISVGQKLIIPNGQSSTSQEMELPYVQLNQLEIGQRIEGERGIFQVNIYEESQRIEYGFFGTTPENSDLPYMILEGSDLQSMQKYNNLPINLWGTVARFGRNETVVVEIDRYEIPFPDLDFQIIKGTQKMMEIDGNNVLTFTADDGITYVQIISSSYAMDEHYLSGNEGDQLLMEVLIIPDELYKGYPTFHMYSGDLAVNPITGWPNRLKITADQFNTYNEPPASTEIYIPPTATIEKVDLVYYVRYPPYALVDPNAGTQYLQPAWRFYGHYSNGDEFEILIQALKQEFLLPELAPFIPPG